MEIVSRKEKLPLDMLRNPTLFNSPSAILTAQFPMSDLNKLLSYTKGDKTVWETGIN